MKVKTTTILFLILALSLVACSGQSDASVSDGQASVGAEAESETSAGSDSLFPLPSDYSNITADDTSVNFQTKASIDEMVAFYRDIFAGMGLSERELLTVIDEGTVSMVFDGHSSGQAVVLQMVDLGESTNVNIRFENV